MENVETSVVEENGDENICDVGDVKSDAGEDHSCGPQGRRDEMIGQDVEAATKGVECNGASTEVDSGSAGLEQNVMVDRFGEEDIEVPHGNAEVPETREEVNDNDQTCEESVDEGVENLAPGRNTHAWSCLQDLPLEKDVTLPDSVEHLPPGRNSPIAASGEEIASEMSAPEVPEDQLTDAPFATSLSAGDASGQTIEEECPSESMPSSDAAVPAPESIPQSPRICDEDERRFFLGGIHPVAFDDEVRKFVGQFGEIEHFDMMKLHDAVRNTQRHRGYAIVTMKTVEDKKKVFEGVAAGKDTIVGKKIEVKPFQKDPRKKKKVFVENVKNLSEEDIRNHFSQFGPVCECTMIPKDHARDAFSIVTFSDEGSYNAAVQQSGQLVNNKETVIVRPAVKNNNNNKPRASSARPPPPMPHVYGSPFSSVYGSQMPPVNAGHPAFARMAPATSYGHGYQYVPPPHPFQGTYVDQSASVYGGFVQQHPAQSQPPYNAYQPQFAQMPVYCQHAEGAMMADPTAYSQHHADYGQVARRPEHPVPPRTEPY